MTNAQNNQIHTPGFRIAVLAKEKLALILILAVAAKASPKANVAL